MAKNIPGAETSSGKSGPLGGISSPPNPVTAGGNKGLPSSVSSPL